MANADTPDDARLARKYGANGIGLARTERMFNAVERLPIVIEMIVGMTALAGTMGLLHTPENERIAFDDLRHVMDPMMVEEAIAKKTTMLRKVRALHETNPMLGHRGVRLGISFPEIYKMQIRAILEAGAECVAAGMDVQPQIKVPQVCTKQELLRVKSYVDEIHAEVLPVPGNQHLVMPWAETSYRRR